MYFGWGGHWEKVNILRIWVAENVDWSVHSMLINYKEFMQLYKNKGIKGAIKYFHDDKGGGRCGISATLLSLMYNIFGYKSHYYTFGIENTEQVHSITLVEINYNDRNIISIQDSHFDISYVNSNEEPYDFIQFINKLKSHKHSDIIVKEGVAKCRDFIIKSIQGYDWIHGQKIKTKGFADIEFEYPDTLSNGVFKYKGKLNHKRMAESWEPVIDDFLQDKGYHTNILYLYLFPLYTSEKYQGNQDQNYQLFYSK